jgi:hypothetical protein
LTAAIYYKVYTLRAELYSDDFLFFLLFPKGCLRARSESPQARGSFRALLAHRSTDALVKIGEAGQELVAGMISEASSKIFPGVAGMASQEEEADCSAENIIQPSARRTRAGGAPLD